MRDLSDMCPGASLPHPRLALLFSTWFFSLSSLCYICYFLLSYFCFLIINVTLCCPFYINFCLSIHFSSSQAFQPSPNSPHWVPPPGTSFLRVLSLGFLTGKSDQQHCTQFPCFCYNFWKASCTYFHQLHNMALFAVRISSLKTSLTPALSFGVPQSTFFIFSLLAVSP